MSFFTYKAINSNGEIVKGFVEGSHPDLAYDLVSSSGLYVLSIRPTSRFSNLYLKKIKTWGIKTKDVVEFANNLSVMLRAGLPLITSLQDIADTTDNKKFRSRLLDIKRAIELGSSFSSALSYHRDIFPEIFINLVKVGEETGRLERSLSDVAIHLQRMQNLKEAIIRALMYPAFAILGTTGAILFWLIYVLPKMADLFNTMSIKLPIITQILIMASDFSRANWYLFLLVPVVIYVIIKLLSRQERTKYYVDAAKLKAPIVRLVVYNKLLALFAEQLRILLTAGITVDKSFDIMINVVNNVVFKRALERVKEDILLGSRINEALKKHNSLFPNMVVRMISIGEASGNLGEQLDYLARYFIDKLDDISQKMGKLLEPIIIIIVGSIFMIIILGLLSPIYDLISGIGAQ
jgi:type II secretory pathway component PulF